MTNLTKPQYNLKHERLLELLTYDPLTGLFTRNIALRRFHAGTISGSVSATLGYWEVRVGRYRYLGHMLAWFYMTSEWPPVTVDHKNTDRSDNRWINLRLATKGQQMMNMGLTSSNTSGAKGVYWDAVTQKWCCEIKANGKKHWLGRFDSFEQAKETVAIKRIEVHGVFARTE